ncbi:hypothetical protein PHLCEN_2v6035 [Hermanssonia centrifuga]|uniref:Uncharacterized protein n=1 Tax=Hermanssonia centrifuga TaxID=98765 RepID=A0A2R6P0N7_9APHY|nr:hypothetical protein PHLCEN_2v6035 [Hermanssonia centrifuga]
MTYNYFNDLTTEQKTAELHRLKDLFDRLASGDRSLYASRKSAASKSLKSRTPPCVAYNSDGRQQNPQKSNKAARGKMGGDGFASEPKLNDLRANDDLKNIAMQVILQSQETFRPLDDVRPRGPVRLAGDKLPTQKTRWPVLGDSVWSCDSGSTTKASTRQTSLGLVGETVQYSRMDCKANARPRPPSKYDTYAGRKLPSLLGEDDVYARKPSDDASLLITSLRKRDFYGDMVRS